MSPRVVEARGGDGARALSRSGRTSGNAIPVATRGQPHEVLMSAGLNQPRPTPPIVVSPSSRRHHLLASGRWKKFFSRALGSAPIFLLFPLRFLEKVVAIIIRRGKGEEKGVKKRETERILRFILFQEEKGREDGGRLHNLLICGV